MERIFKIRTKTNPDPRGLYPSERRYSASIVLGLSVVFLQLGLYSILMGSLIVHKVNLHESLISKGDNTTVIDDNNVDNESVVLTTEDSLRRLEARLENDLTVDEKYGMHYYIDIPALVCAGCFVMALGQMFCFASGVLACKRWYIDHNITFFFLFSSFSTLTSSICLLISLLTAFHMDFYNFDRYIENPAHKSPITFSLAMNVIILSLVSTIWSFLSTRVSYRGMKNEYPDDIIISRGGRTVEVSVIRKGSKNVSVLPPEIINSYHFGKLSKYLPKADSNSDLPKEESSAEYEQRVNKFLNGGNAQPK